MKPRVCLVCLKTYNGDEDLLASEQECGITTGAPLLTRFLKFAENYLDLSSVTTQQLLLSGGGKEVFCEKCELSLIIPICQIYLEFLSAQLRLSSELEQLGKLLDSSKVSGSEKLRVLNINSLSNQLGIRNLSQLEGLRTSLAQKCLLKRKQALPIVLLTSRFGEGQTGTDKTENDESSSCHENIEKVWMDVDPLTCESDNDNSLDLKQDGLMAMGSSIVEQRQTGEGEATQATGWTPVRSGIKMESFYQVSNPDLIFENENYEEIEDSPSGLIELKAIPKAEGAGKRVNGKLYNGRRCPKCSKVLKDEKQYQVHYRNYHIPMSCNTCGKMCGSKKSLRMHYYCVHPKRGIYRCRVCSKIYHTAYRLHDHLRRIHPSEKRRHDCPHCNTSFKLKNALKKHVAAIHNPGSMKKRAKQNSAVSSTPPFSTF